MSEHPSSQLLARYMQRTLPSDAFLKVHQHILSCPGCSEKCDESQALPEDYAALREALLSPSAAEAPSHLSSAELRAYANGEMGEIDLEVAEGHLQLCYACSEGARRAEAESAGTAQATPLGTIAPELPSRPEPPAFSFLNGWRRPALVLGFSATLILILLAGLALIRTRMTDGSGTELASGQNNSDAAQRPVVSDNRGNSNPAAIDAGNSNEGRNDSGPEAGTPAQPSETPAKTTLVINDGGRTVTMDERGNLYGFEELPPGLQREIKEMILTGKARRPRQPAEFDGERSALMSDSSDDGLPFRLLSPFNRVVPDNRPTFRWQPLSGAESYTVTVADADLNQVSVSQPVKATEWKITTPLKYGGVYSWQVTALKEGQRITSPVLPAPQAKFKVIEYDRMRELSHARSAYPNSHLTLAAIYLRAGLTEQARQELRSLVRSNPQSSTAKSLLRSLDR